jgi:hypothetical protein
MTPPPEPSDPHLRRLLRSLPEREAPSALEQRVLAELARRAAAPAWWQRSQAAWPMPVRIAFFVLSAAIAVVVMAAAGRLAGFVPSAPLAAQVASWNSTLAALSHAGSAVFAAIPSVWLYSALALVAACYATLAGVGAAAYHAFFRRT